MASQPPHGAATAHASQIQYTRNNASVNQTPSTPLLFDPSLLGEDEPPPSYEEATGIAPNASNARPPGPSQPSRAQHAPALEPVVSPIPPRLPVRPVSSAIPHPMPGIFPRSAAPPVATPAGAYATDSKASTAGPRSGVQQAAPGSVPLGRQFPATVNLYGDGWSQQYTLGEHQHAPLYAVRLRRALGPYGLPGKPFLTVHNGPSLAMQPPPPVLASVDRVMGLPVGLPAAEDLAVTLPPPLTYSGRGSTAVRLELVVGWSHHYRFVMEVGTTLANVHREPFEWRHSTGGAVAALGGVRDGWKLVRLSTAALEGDTRPPAQRMPSPMSGFLTSDGREVVATFADARMSMTKQLKFAFTGTGLTGLLGERWAVMAVTSALGIWEKEEALR